MASTTPHFTLFLLLSILSTTIAHHPTPKSTHHRPPHNFIQSSCRVTRYPPLCYRTLSGYGSKIGRSQRQLALTALAVSLSQARSAVRFVSQMKTNKGIKHRELDAVKDCIDNMSDGVDQLTRSFSELSSLGHINNGEDFMWHMSNVQTWVSSALTDETTCVDGLSTNGHHHVSNGGMKVKGAIQNKVNRVAQLTSNALALVNHFVNRN